MILMVMMTSSLLHCGCLAGTFSLYPQPPMAFMGYHEGALLPTAQMRRQPYQCHASLPISHKYVLANLELYTCI